MMQQQRVARFAIALLRPATNASGRASIGAPTTVIDCSGIFSSSSSSSCSSRPTPSPPRCASSASNDAGAIASGRKARAAEAGGISWAMSRRGSGGGGEMGEAEGGRARQPRVVIIGAGMAGIAAAQRLQKQAGAGRYDLKILEASDRIGGRICSAEFNGEGIELGATWIHGIEGSPLYKRALEIGAMKNAERAWEGKDGFLDNAVVKAEGGLDVPHELLEPVVEAYKQLLQDAQEMAEAQPKEMVAGAAAIDTAPVKMSDLSSYDSVGAYLRGGLDKFLTQHEVPAQYVSSRISATSTDRQPLGNTRWTTRSLQEGCFKMHENLERNITSADDLCDIDLVDYNEYLEFPGEHQTIAKGYSSVVHALASSLPPGLVQFGHNVEKIVWNDLSPYPSAPVSIHCQGGSVIEADHVIITVSLGVLKAKTLGSLESSVREAHMHAGNSTLPSRISESDVERELRGESDRNGEDGAVQPREAELFDPPLPMWKLDSISRLGFGVVDKVFVQIEPAEKGGPHRPLQFIFDPSVEAGEVQHSDVPAWIRKTFSLYPIHETSHALVAWFAGREALQVESLTDEEILSGISKTLASFGIPEGQQGTFLDIRRSKWGKNPLFRGSYSYVKVGSTGEDIDALAEPLPKLGDGGLAPLQVLFAGEATHRHYYSTTHGAYFSGLREAERLLQHYVTHLVELVGFGKSYYHAAPCFVGETGRVERFERRNLEVGNQLSAAALGRACSPPCRLSCGGTMPSNESLS